MVDFAAIKAARAAQAEKDKAAYVPLMKAPAPEGSDKAKPLPKPRAEGRDVEDDVNDIELMLTPNCSLTEWEQTFCRSVLAQLKRGASGVSVKQGVILDKLTSEHILYGMRDPTPKGNPPAQFAPKPQQRGVNNPHLQFDDMDDDIPF